MAQHYFSYKGSDLQISAEGLFRSLLHQTLKDRKELIKVAFPERHQAFSAGGRGVASGPRVLELKTALTTVIQTQPSIFFFAVVGLDEYDASATEMSLLVDTFKRLSTYPNFKALLSRRPWVVFEESFDLCPRLRLHELIRPDIILFATDQITQHPKFKILHSHGPTATQNIINEIVDASAGVFLWVALVVRSLLEGLGNHDSFEDLQARLREFPSELEELFLHMWNKIPTRYQSQASRLLQLVRAGTLGGWQFSLLGLSFSEEDERSIEEADVTPTKEQEVGERHETMRVHLLTRCVGLVEIHRTSEEDPIRNGPESRNWERPTINNDLYFNNIEDKHGYPRVEFIHKTVYEFLSSADLRQKLADVATPPGSAPPFCADVGLLRSTTLRIKTFVGTAGHNNSWVSQALEALVRRCLFLAKQAELAAERPQTRMLRQLDVTMAQLQHRAVHNNTHRQHHWSRGLPHFAYPMSFDRISFGKDVLERVNNFLLLAVFHGLALFVKDHSLGDPGFIREARELPFLWACLLSFHQLQGDHITFHKSVDDSLLTMLRYLLDNGVDPNGIYAHPEEPVWIQY
ncbi:hypothetical protein OQA88_1850 [Cercophora sp. LCS_1]